mgnify:CR=1 FL=1
MLYIVNIMTYAFPFMNRFYGKSGLLNMIIFSVSALLIDCKCVMLLYFVVRVIPVKSGHGHFGQNQNKKIISRLKIVYINNIYYLYILSLELFSHQKTNLTEMTMTEFDRDFVLHFDNCPGKISHFVSLSFCVIFVFEREKCSI